MSKQHFSLDHVNWLQLPPMALFTGMTKNAYIKKNNNKHDITTGIIFLKPLPILNQLVSELQRNFILIPQCISLDIFMQVPSVSHSSFLVFINSRSFQLHSCCKHSISWKWKWICIHYWLYNVTSCKRWLRIENPIADEDLLRELQLVQEVKARIPKFPVCMLEHNGVGFYLTISYVSSVRKGYVHWSYILLRRQSISERTD